MYFVLNICVIITSDANYMSILFSTDRPAVSMCRVLYSCQVFTPNETANPREFSVLCI